MNKKVSELPIDANGPMVVWSAAGWIVFNKEVGNLTSSAIAVHESSGRIVSIRLFDEEQKRGQWQWTVLNKLSEFK